MITKLTEKMDSFLDMHTPWYDCVVYHKGKCVYRHHNGYLDLDKTIPASGDELYNIFSCSKLITCVAALMIYEKGLYNLNDKISDYLPEFKEMYVKQDDGSLKKAENEITIKHLFTMTAGFSYALCSPSMKLFKEETNRLGTTREFCKYLAKEPLLFEPGEKYNYSLCHDVLAAVMEVITGIEFNQFCTENIFKPLEMNSTTYLLPEKDYENVAPIYCYRAEENKLDAPVSKMPAYRLTLNHASGGAGCVSTVDDYIKFLEGVRTYKLIGKETVDLMATNHLTQKQLETYTAEGYGYGLGVRCPLNDNIKTDFGWGGAAGAYLAIDRESQITIYYAQHVTSSPVQPIRSQILPIIQEILK